MSNAPPPNQQQPPLPPMARPPPPPGYRPPQEQSGQPLSSPLYRPGGPLPPPPQPPVPPGMQRPPGAPGSPMARPFSPPPPPGYRPSPSPGMPNHQLGIRPPGMQSPPPQSGPIGRPPVGAAPRPPVPPGAPLSPQGGARPPVPPGSGYRPQSGGRPALVSQPPPQQQPIVPYQTNEVKAATPPPAPRTPDQAGPARTASPTTAGTQHKASKRQYPKDITDAYADTVGGSYGQYQYGGSSVGHSTFAPAAVTGINQTPVAPAEPQFFTPAAPAQPPVPSTQGPYAQAYVQPASAPMGAGGVAGVTQQFSGMHLGGQNLHAQSLHLIGLQLNPHELDAPPPPIILPPNTSVTQSDKSNCDPSYKRCTFNAVPGTTSLLNKSRLPFALVIAPYRSVKEGDDPVPVVTDTVIARCRRCRTYINPFVIFVDAGQRWKCNICFLINEVPSQFDWDVHTNTSADRWKRAEINHAVVEFVAPAEYMVRPPQPPVYLFIIDVSYPAVQSGAVATAARTILESLDRIPNEDKRTKVGFITVDSSLHFYSLNPGMSEPQMLVVSDLDDVFLPQPDDLLVHLAEARKVVESLLGRLGDMFKETRIAKNALGPALQAGYKLISPIGGKIVVLQSSLPNFGPGALKQREDPKALGTSKESALLQSADPFYKRFAVDCSRSQVCVDMFLLGSQYSDVATLACCPRFTGGQTFFYPAFNAGRSEDALKFAHEFGEFLASPIALEAVMRVRASRGVRLTTFHGNFFVRQTDLLAMPNVSRDHSYVIEVTLEENITAPTVCFQTALLHTTCFGERRIRVLTLCLPVTNNISELYASADQIAIATFLANKAVERSVLSKLEDAREALTNKMIDIMGVYKSALTSAGTGASPQLAVSHNLKLLPLLSLALLKHVGLRSSSQIPTDLRAYAQCLLTTLPPQLLIPYLHPQFYSLHNMPLEVGTVGADGVIMPEPLNLTSEKLERPGAYILEDGQNMFLWVGREVPPQLLMDLLGVQSYEHIRGGKSTLPQLDNPFSQRVNAIIGKKREQRRGVYYPQLYVVKEDGDPALRLWFLSHLIEDRTDTVMSYPQWLAHIKDKVNAGSF